MEQIRNTNNYNPLTVIVSNDQNGEGKSQDTVSMEAILPKYTLSEGRDLYLYQGFWCPASLLHNVINFQQNFEARKTDVILASKPKCGTTWLKSLVYSILNRTRFTNSNHPLQTNNPHDLVPYFEFNLYLEGKGVPDLSIMDPPRIFATHIPYQSLPTSIKKSGCRIVYVARNPFDTLVSLWHFRNSKEVEESKKVPIDNLLDLFCRGVEAFGPHWDHVLGYWKQSLETPNKVLFLKYEDMKENGTLEIKKLAEFLGCEFSLEEEKQGIIDEILQLCSLNNLKELEVNKTGKFMSKFDNKVFFRKGEVGDWVNHLSPIMVDRLEQVMNDKFADSGLEFKICP